MTTPRGRALVSLAFLLAACGSSPDGSNAPDSGPACSEIGCGPALRVEFTRPSWPAATYRIEVVADGVSGWCEVAIPLGCHTPAFCSGGLDFGPETSGCAQAPSVHRIAGMTFDRITPAAVMVRVLQGGQPVGLGSFLRSM